MQLHCDDSAGSVWRIQLRPGERDEIVVTLEGMQQLAELLDAAERSQDCRVLVLEGSDGSFCRGMDLKGVAGEGDASEGVARYADCLSGLRNSSKAIVAAVDGEVLAGGVGLAAVADLLIATERSLFGLPEVMLGLLPAMVLPVLMERMPAQKVRRMAMTASTIDAAEAQRLGLVDQLAADAEGLERALRGQLKQLLRMEPGAIAALKRLTLSSASASFGEGLAAGREATDELVTRPQTRETIQSFLAGEPLPWFARYRTRSK